MSFFIEYAKSFHRLLGIFDKQLLQQRKEFFAEHENYNFIDVPIFIISYNRLSYLKSIIQQLSDRGFNNINIIDNASTYPPLLEYYDTLSYKIFRLKENGGHMVFWENDIFKEYRNDLYVVTDPDISILEECPDDFLRVFFKLLKKYPRLKKVGFSLRIDDIPHDASLYEQVTKWEKMYTKFKIPNKNAFTADIDTTFALYLPDYLDCSRHFITAVRTGYPYQVRHLPWYKKSDDITDEDIYYSNHRTNGFWDETHGDFTSEGKKGIDSGWSN